MSKYIDYDAIDYRNDRLHDKSEEFLNGVYYMAQRIEDAPSIDIVHCTDCIHWKTNVCKAWSVPRVMYANDFCSVGERRDNE